MAEGRDPRLVLDSSICGLNPAVHLPEHVALPTASDVQRSFLAEDCYASLIALSLDFKAAHKCCKVKPSDQGTLLFRVGGKLYYYTVCHFGARFSAYWWQRTGGLILRCIHALLCNHPHRAWLYVDDLLALLRKGESAEAAALIVAMLAALHAPISWKKPPSQELRKVLFSQESLILKFALKSRLMLFSCAILAQVLCSEVGTAKVCFLGSLEAVTFFLVGSGPPNPVL